MSKDPKSSFTEPTNENYDAAVSWCRRTIAKGDDMMFSTRAFHEGIDAASRRYGMSFEALHSLFRNTHVTHMKRTSRSHKSQTMRHVKSYLNGTSILSVAKRCNHPPSMMARLIVENVAACSSGGNAGGGGYPNASGGNADGKSSSGGHGDCRSTKAIKKFVTDSMRYPEKMLGCASTTILPEYLFSERNGGSNSRKNGNNMNNSGSGVSPVGGAHETCGDKDRSRAVPLSRLCLEVREAIDSDPMYGPRHDKERHNIGIEYELLLEETLRSMGIPYETEEELRERGTAKTPDILLSCPVGIKVRRKGINQMDDVRKSLYSENLEGGEVEEGAQFEQGAIGNRNADNWDEFQDDEEFEWKVVCWIDSKALFGDVETHTNSVLPQVETYVHRFGPGLVLYWFGHAPLSRLGDGHGDVSIVGGDLPEYLLMPTGMYHGRDGAVRTSVAVR